ncbi:MAG: MFS transporter [Anaerolineaceae bacterium]|nr:MFS transporter [Anaerolineaceae bacterium]
MKFTAVLKNSDWKMSFFTIWIGQAISLVSSELVQFALIWWLIEKSGSATILAVATMITLLPSAILSPFLGALVDRWNRRYVMIIADSTIALSLISLFYFSNSENIQIWQVFLIMLIRAIGGAIHMPAMLASTSLMVPKEHLGRIAGINQMLNGIIMVIVPPLGALLLGSISFNGIIGIEIVGAFVGIVPLLFIIIPQPEKELIAKKTQSIWRDVLEGFKYINQWKGAVGMLVISTMVNFIMRPAFQLLGIVVVNQFGGDEIQFGWMAAALGAGFLSGGFVLSMWGGFKRKMQTSLIGIFGAGLSILLFGLVPQISLYLGFVCIFLAGFMMPLCMGPIQALIQSSVDPSIQGRVFTIIKSASTLISPLSLLIAGPVFDKFGPLTWYIWGGVVAIIISVIGYMNPIILNLGAPGKSKLKEI